MRRLALAAVCGTLVLAACSDQSPTEPTLPEPEQSFTSCRPPHHFPIVQVSALIPKIFPKGRLQIEAAARVGATALLWETCKPSLAQRSAVGLVNFMNANSSNLIGTQTQRNTFISLVLNGVDIPFTTPPGGTGDFGVGFFDPANTNNTVVVTQNGTALVELEPGSFNQPTTIVVSRKSDGFTLTNFDGNQFPPYFDYDAINAAGDHVLKNGKLAIVAFCLLDPVYTYPENPRIGHNPVAGAPGFPFEVLEEVNLAADHPDLAAQLNCGNLAPNTVIIGGFGRGLPGLANAVWRNTKYYLGPVAETALLPEALYASTVGTLPPPAGRAASLSPFGIVEFTERTNTTTTITDDAPDPSNEGEAISVSFTVTADGEAAFAPAGNVTVSDGNGASCTATIDVGDCLLTPAGVGTLTLTATYEGDEHFNGSSGTEGHTVLVAPGSNGFGVNSGDDGLSAINLTTGVSSFIGRLGGADPDLYATPVAMGVRPSDGTLYVWNNSNDAVPAPISTGVLLTVDPNTGQATPVNAGTGPQGALSALAFTPGGEFEQPDTLYGFDSDLVRIDLATGAIAATIGPIGVRIGGADIDCNGTLYGVELTAPEALTQKFVTINPGTGAVMSETSLSQDIGTIGSIVFTSSGVLIGSGLNGDLGDILFDIDKSTGAVSNVRPITGGTGPQGLGVARSCNIIN